MRIKYSFTRVIPSIHYFGFTILVYYFRDTFTLLVNRNFNLTSIRLKSNISFSYFSHSSAYIIKPPYSIFAYASPSGNNSPFWDGFYQLCKQNFPVILSRLSSSRTVVFSPWFCSFEMNTKLSKFMVFN